MNSKLEALSARHPRYTIFLIVLSFVIILLYVNSSHDSPFSGSTWGGRPPPYDYAARAHMNDMYCQGAVQEHGFQVGRHGPPPPPSRGYETFQGHPPHPDQYQGRPWGYGPPPPGPWGPPPPPPFGPMHHGKHGGPEGKHPPLPPPFWGHPPPSPDGDAPPPPPHHWWGPPPPPPSDGEQSYGMPPPPPHSHWGPPPPHEFHGHRDSRPTPPMVWGEHQHGHRPAFQDDDEWEHPPHGPEGEHPHHGPPPPPPPPHKPGKHDKHEKPCPEDEAGSPSIKAHRPRPCIPKDAALQKSEKHYQEYVKHRKESADEAAPSWKSFAPAFRCPHHLELLGEPEDGGKWVCGFEYIAPKEQCVVYSIGADGSSFETTVEDRSAACTVFGYGDKPSENTDVVTEEEETTATEESDVPATVPTNPLDDLLETNGHKFIDILKFDINSESDFAVLDAFLDEYDFPQLASRAPYPPPRRALPPPKREPVLPFGQLLLSVAVSSDDDKGELSINNFGAWFEKLERMGLRPFFAAPSLSNSRNAVDYSFINIRGEHELLSALPPPRPHHFHPAT